MGYTHYYNLKGEINQKKWDVFIEDVKVLKKHLPKHSNSSGGYCSDEPLFLNGCSRNKKAIFNDEEIIFNGGKISASKRVKVNNEFKCDELSHETFYLSRKGGREFCKTARKPYDLMVQSVILLAKHHFPTEFSFSSDGDFDDWQESYKFVVKYFPNVENVPKDL